MFVLCCHFSLMYQRLAAGLKRQYAIFLVNKLKKYACESMTLLFFENHTKVQIQTLKKYFENFTSLVESTEKLGYLCALYLI